MAHHSALRTPHAALRIAVVGGGISGLAAAHRLVTLSEQDRPLDVALFEAGGRLGGVIGTRRVGGYLVETGPDMFITNKPAALELCHELGLADQLISTDERHRRSLVLRHGRPVPVPEGFTLLTPTRIWPVLTSPIFSPLGKLRMGLEYILPKRNGDADESLASFVRRRFGREALERLVQPLVGGIYTGDPEQLSLQATLPRFRDMERAHGSVIRALHRQKPSPREHAAGARYGLFVTLAEGLQTLVDALSARIEQKASIRLNSAVTALAPEESPPPKPTAPPSSCDANGVGLGSVSVSQDAAWQLTLADGSRERFDAVVLALPAYRAADLVAEFDAELAGDLRGIEYASSAVVVTGHELKDVAHPLDAFGLVVPAIEHRRVLAVSFTSRKFPGRASEGRVQLRTFLGGALQPELLSRSDEELIAIVREELRALLGVTGVEDFALVCRYDRAMPQYHVGHLERVRRIEAHCDRHERLSVCGNAYHGVGLPDCIANANAAVAGVLPVRSPAFSGKPGF